MKTLRCSSGKLCRAERAARHEIGKGRHGQPRCGLICFLVNAAEGLLRQSDEGAGQMTRHRAGRTSLDSSQNLDEPIAIEREEVADCGQGARRRGNWSPLPVFDRTSPENVSQQADEQILAALPEEATGVGAPRVGLVEDPVGHSVHMHRRAFVLDVDPIKHVDLADIGEPLHRLAVGVPGVMVGRQHHDALAGALHRLVGHRPDFAAGIQNDTGTVPDHEGRDGTGRLEPAGAGKLQAEAVHCGAGVDKQLPVRECADNFATEVPVRTQKDPTCRRGGHPLRVAMVVGDASLHLTCWLAGPFDQAPTHATGCVATADHGTQQDEDQQGQACRGGQQRLGPRPGLVAGVKPPGKPMLRGRQTVLQPADVDEGVGSAHET